MVRLSCFILLLFTCLVAPAQTNYVDKKETRKVSMGREKIFTEIKKWGMTADLDHDISVQLIDYDKETGVLIFDVKRKDERFLYGVSLLLSARLQIEVGDSSYTYVFKDGKYMLEVNSDYYGTNIHTTGTTLLRYMADNLSIAESLMGDDTSIPERLEMRISLFDKWLNETPKYRKPKDEKKGKVNPSYTRYAERKRAAEQIASNYSIMVMHTANNLYKHLSDYAKTHWRENVNLIE